MKTVLYIEDNQEIIEIITLLLAKSDYQLLTQIDASKAVDMCLQKNPDLVLVDINMPEMNGIEVTQKLRNAGFSNPIIMLTASESPEDKKQARAAGCNDYILKTLDMHNVRAIIDDYLGEMGELIH